MDSLASKLAWVAGGLALGLAFSLGILWGGSTPAAAEPRGLTSSEPAIDASAPITELAREVRRLRSFLEQAEAVGQATPGERRPVDPREALGAEEDLAVLAGWLEKIDQRLALLVTRSASFDGAGRGGELVVPASPLPIQIPDGKLGSTAWDRFEKDHLFWTASRVLETYGVPDSFFFRENGVSSWYYERGDRDVALKFYEGSLYEVDD